MSQLDQIIAEGTIRADYRRTGKPSGHIDCADGFRLSVQAGNGMYCSPRPFFTADEDFEGPYTAVEVGYPSERPEPWGEWSEWVEDENHPTGTVYSQVPVEAVRALIELHGGAA
ncbi:hypothetical protein [Rathayibacter sp. Leaf248]|uniref:hypothetical protein n=1 Tax=Rathayibacter sp. Leaf248 TaxID=2876555 RepID=UPI001E425F11|nr:hypothetical protein [Rathayibacter sp. Leaf248]